MQFALLVAYIIILALISAADLKWRIIPDVLVFPSIVLLFLLSFWLGDPVATIVAGLEGAMLLAIIAFITRRVGGGDIALAGLIGMMIVSAPLVLLSLGMAWVVAGIFLNKHKQSAIPFAPAMSLSAIGILVLQLVM